LGILSVPKSSQAIWAGNNPLFPNALGNIFCGTVAQRIFFEWSAGPTPNFLVTPCVANARYVFVANTHYVAITEIYVQEACTACAATTCAGPDPSMRKPRLPMAGYYKFENDFFDSSGKGNTLLTGPGLFTVCLYVV
jgi:hypothetical protein